MAIQELRYFTKGLSFLCFNPDFAAFSKDWFAQRYNQGYRTLRVVLADHSTDEAPVHIDLDPLTRFVNQALCKDFRVIVCPETTRDANKKLRLDILNGNPTRFDAFYDKMGKWLSLYPDDHVAMEVLTEPKWFLTDETGTNEEKLKKSSVTLETWQAHILPLLRTRVPKHILMLGMPGTGQIGGSTNPSVVPSEFGYLTPVKDANTCVWAHAYIGYQFLHAQPGTRTWPFGVPADPVERYNLEGKAGNVDTLRFFMNRFTSWCQSKGTKWYLTEWGPVFNRYAPEGIAYMQDFHTVTNTLKADWLDKPLVMQADTPTSG